MNHVNEEQLIKYQFDLLDEAEARLVREHLDGCKACQGAYETLKAKFGQLDMLKDDDELMRAPEELIQATVKQVRDGGSGWRFPLLSNRAIAIAAMIMFAFGGVYVVYQQLYDSGVKEGVPRVENMPLAKKLEEEAVADDVIVTKENITDEKFFADEERLPEPVLERRAFEERDIADTRYAGSRSKTNGRAMGLDAVVAERKADEFIPDKPPFAPASNIELTVLPRRDAVELTVYNAANLTLVREKRMLTMKRGWNWLQYMWTNTLIDPTSLELMPQEQASKIHVEQLTFPPRAKDWARWLIKSEVDGQVPFEITYFTSGIHWRAFYEGTLNEDETKLAIRNYVRLDNQSGEDYEQAATRLVLGQINVLEPVAQLARRQYPWGSPLPEPKKDKGTTTRARDGVSDDLFSMPNNWYGYGFIKDRRTDLDGLDLLEQKKVFKQSLSEYVLYRIEGQETILNGWGKRLESLEAGEIPVESLYKYNPELYGNSVRRFVSFANDEEHELGTTPLPEGAFRLTREVDGAGHLSYVGAAALKYVPVNENVELDLGATEKVLVEPVVMKTETENYLYDDKGNIDGWDEIVSKQLRVVNTRSLPVRVEIVEAVGSAFWDIELDEMNPAGAVYEKYDMDHIKFTLELGAESKMDVGYELTRYNGRRSEK